MLCLFPVDVITALNFTMPFNNTWILFSQWFHVSGNRSLLQWVLGSCWWFAVVKFHSIMFLSCFQGLLVVLVFYYDWQLMKLLVRFWTLVPKFLKGAMYRKEPTVFIYTYLHLIIAWSPLTCDVLSKILSELGSGCPWCADRSCAL